MLAERCLLLWLFLSSRGGDVALSAAEEGGVSAADGLPSPAGDHAAGRSAQHHTPPGPTAEPPFVLKVLVKDVATRRPLSGASVDLYVNHTLQSSARTGERGELLLRVPYGPGLGVMLLANMEGYVPSPLPWRTTKRPVYSAVTLLLLPHSQGNLWVFQDSVLITGKLPDISSQPRVKFPKNLLTLSEATNISSVMAYLTIPQRHLAEDCVNCTPGIVSNKAASRSIELKPVAAVCAKLYSGSQELEIRGPIQMSLPLADGTNLRPADTVPAWAFNSKTGAWENQGLGFVKLIGDRLVWTYTASHLGYWIAAPLHSPNDYMGHASSMDFISYHSYLLVGILGGTLAIVIGFLSVLLCHCGGSRREPRRRRRRARFSKLTVLKKDQTTSTHMDEGSVFLASRGIQCDPSATPRHQANYNIYVEDPGGRPGAPLYENIPSDRGPQVHYINNEEAARLRDRSEQNRANLATGQFFQDKLVHIFKQPVALMQATQESGCKSATFPRNGGDFDPHSEPGGDAYNQTLPKIPHHHSQAGSNPQQSGQDEPQALETPPQGQGLHYGQRYNSLLESSVSVPGTLNEAAGMGAFNAGRGAPGELQGISERTLLELTRGKSHPRAWFVSLDGKPAASVRHSIIELQQHRRHRPASSNDTSLDSGVDMNEPREQSVRESIRSARASSLPHRGRGGGGGRHGDEQDLSSSESGTTATCTPEDPNLRSILDGSSGAIPNIPEERDGMDTSSAREDSETTATPPPRRLRKVREKGRAEKRSAKHMREGRPLNKPS